MTTLLILNAITTFLLFMIWSKRTHVDFIIKALLFFLFLGNLLGAAMSAGIIIAK